uniref:Parcxpwnx01 n=1 Tax=Periplaneta americana TaxID=6978 RepID=Q5MBV6_PERAM|nr:Parcxpwnx01 [Periplaneta americana]
MNAKVVLYIAVVLCGTQLTSAGLISSALNSTIHAIANQINDIKGLVENGLKTAVDNAVNKLGDIEQQVQNQLQTNFNNLANKGAAAQACLDNAKANVSSVIEKAKGQLKSFVVVEGIKILPWVGKVNKTKNKIEEVIANLTSGSKACLAQGSIFDLIGKAACETALVNSLKQTVSDIVTEVQQEVESGKTILEAVLADAQKKIPPIIQSAVSQLQTIVQTEAQCLAGAVLG